jgi:hypothetical protein
MNSRYRHPRWIEVAAPDAQRALALEQRLAHMHAAAIARGRSWSVELEDDDDSLDEVVASVRHWLREQHLRTTTITVDGTAHPVVLDAGGPFAGCADDPVLTHEP